MDGLPIIELAEKVFYVISGGFACSVSRRIPRAVAENTYDCLGSAHDRVPDLGPAVSQAQGRSDFPARLPVIPFFGALLTGALASSASPDTFVLYLRALKPCLIGNAR